MLRLKSCLVLASMLTLIVGLAASAGSWSQAPTVALDPDKVTFFENSVRPVFAESCVTCHMDGNAGGGLRLDKAVTAEQATSLAEERCDLARWKTLHRWQPLVAKASKTSCDSDRRADWLEEPC